MLRGDASHLSIYSPVQHLPHIVHVNLLLPMSALEDSEPASTDFEPLASVLLLLSLLQLLCCIPMLLLPLLPWRAGLGCCGMTGDQPCPDT